MKLLDSQTPVGIEAVFDGLTRLEQSRLLFCGLARNIESKIYASLDALHQLGFYAKSHKVLVYENDSSDRTPFLLRSYASRHNWVDARVNKFGDRKYGSVVDPERLDQMAKYRNQCQDIIRSDYSDVDYVVIVDLDLVDVSIDGFISSFSYDFDVMGAYSKVKRHKWLHYDYYAFREIGDTTYSDKNAEPEPDFDTFTAPIRVDSCFGGMAIYPLPVFLRGSYDNTDCDHVTFHKSLRIQGMNNIYLNPRLVITHK